jgi:hypothetical protein
MAAEVEEGPDFVPVNTDLKAVGLKDFGQECFLAFYPPRLRGLRKSCARSATA